MSDKEEDKESRSAEQNRRRQIKFREKQKAIRENTYAVPILDQAKADLKAMDPMDLQALLLEEKYKSGLTDDDMEKLKVFIKNRNRLIKQSMGIQSEREREELSNKEKAQRLCNQLIPELHSALMKPQTEQDRKNLILEKIQENLFTFLEFMETKLDTSNDFLKLIVELQGRLDRQTFAKLFIRVCANYQCNSLEIKSDMAILALDFLISQKQDRDAALGLLRLMYINNISLVDAGVDLLLQFQDTYELQVMSVFKSLQGPKMQVRESLPATMFCFTPPILESMKSGGAELHTQVPIQWLPYFVSIICYSFISDQAQFEDFVSTFKSGVGELYDQLKSCNFTNLLQELCELTRQMQPKFFKQLANQTVVLKNAFDMVRKRAITKFDEHIVGVLIHNDSDSMNILAQRPIVLPQKAQSHLKKITAQFEKINQHLVVDRIELEKPIPQEAQEIFNHQGISSLLPIQHACMNWLLQSEFIGKHFIQMETGQGKTALCLTLATLNSKSEGISIIVNNSQDLLFRDFKTAMGHAQALNIQVHLADNTGGYAQDKSSLIFCPPELLLCVVEQLQKVTNRRLVLLVDEFDSLLFDTSACNQDVHQAIEKIQVVYGMSGSQLQTHHKDYIAGQFNGQCVDFTVNLFNRQPPVQHEVKVFQFIKDYCNEIVRLCVLKSKEVPIVCIIDEQHEKIASSLKKCNTPVLDLCDAEMSTVESSLRIFNEKQASAYSVALINENQGRGLDFKSSNEIEEGGGVFVIIGVLPKSILQYKQFIGRTGRIGNKGQYSVILLDKESKGFVGSMYLTRKLEELKNIDLLKFQRMPSFNMTKAKSLFEKEASIKNLYPKVDAPAELEEEKESGFIEPFNQVIAVHDRTMSDASVPLAEQGMANIFEDQTSQTAEVAKSVNLLQQNLKTSESPPQKLRRSRRFSSPHSLTHDVDKGYFDGYGRLEIHNEMLNDRVRMKKYKEAIDAMCKNKIVVDVGAGTAFLSCQAARAGATKVYALENAEIVHHAQKVVKDNKLAHIVKVIQGEASQFELGDARADVIVSEWMGYMLIYERMLPSVLTVRNKCLKEGGVMIPSKASMWIAAISMPPQSEDIDLRSIKKASYKKAQVFECKASWVCSSIASIFNIDLQTEEFESNSFKSDFTVSADKKAKVTGFVIWFETELCPGVILSTSPMEEPTHWLHTILQLRDDKECQEGNQIRGTIAASPLPRNHRALKVDLDVQFESEAYTISEQYRLEVN